MGRECDSLDLDAGKRLSVIAGTDGLAALPQVCDPDGRWRRARPGDGVGESLLKLLTAAPATRAVGSFTLHSWASRCALGERPITVDQTNESVIVGDAAVVKWATHLQEGPHPAPHRIEVLRANGFRHMPSPWGLVTWRPADGPETLVVSVDEYLPDAVDGWTWAVDLLAEAAHRTPPRTGPAVAAAAEVGVVIAELHSALSVTATIATQADADRWCSAAFATLDQAQALSNSATSALLRERREQIEQILGALGGLAGSTVIEGHGDLHVGQVLRHDGGYVVTDFDGNPVLPAEERALPIPAVVDVAGLTQSLTHAAIVARRHHQVDPGALIAVEKTVRQAFLQAYAARLAELGHGELYDAAPLAALRLQQALREIVYAARHLPRWMYVPDAALPMLLEERNSGGS
ncbi:glucosamine kinase [Mycobacterium sp. BK086]|uniref:glucosamine kinase n=1 Tax=Mycobacterium sp. BK086 TaxID=2512165 RepID=UPI00105CCFB3|nr:glucosamine kinase [Mycobacterium sp. BK086]